ncbi:hypothetical protein [Hyalangium versicolor]|uniref:hypothetical protein n=1 Tax=Hyalangium versicolor TaxID=2861190 RepID=UPI001CCA29B8|nr:hypothetical protein [Hyalangium versicolor]
MKTSVTSRFQPLALATLSASLLLGCGGVEGEFEDSAPTETELATTSEALTVNGITATWTKVGTPYAASRIAVCDYDTIYALNDDATLHRGNGTDNGWVYKGYPSAARDIGCSGDSWVWALNEDKSFYENHEGGSDTAWTYRGTVPTLGHIGSYLHPSSYKALGLNTDGSAYSYDYSTKKWTYEATFLGAAEATKVKDRWFVLIGGHVNFSHGSPLTLTSFPIKAGTLSKLVRDVSAASPYEVWALTEGRELYKGVLSEAACQDGLDNEGDSRADGNDPDCYPSLGTSLCGVMPWDGSFCLSRLGISSNALAVCSGGKLVSTRGGDWCNEYGAGGSDTIGILQ